MDRICENCKHAVYGAIGNYCRIDKRGIKSKDKCPNSQFEKVEEKADCSGCASDCGGCSGFWDPGVKTVMVTVDDVQFEITPDDLAAADEHADSFHPTYVGSCLKITIDGVDYEPVFTSVKYND